MFADHPGGRTGILREKQTLEFDPRLGEASILGSEIQVWVVVHLVYRADARNVLGWVASVHFLSMASGPLHL